MTLEQTGTCAVEGCDRPIFAGKGCGRGMCGAHYARARRGIDLHKPIREHRADAWQRLVTAALALADAETDHDSERAEWLLRSAAKAWAENRRAA